jgi:hypothetical protein
MAQIPRNQKNGRPTLNFYGFDGGGWFETDEYILGRSYGRQKLYDWSMHTGLATAHKGNIYHVTHATESHPGFRRAIEEITDKYPELEDYLIEFDGPRFPLIDLLQKPLMNDWSQIEFLHGTSTALWPQIQQQGLLPRATTGQAATYGSAISSAKPGNPNAVYLTTQLTTANFAAIDAAKFHGGKPLILKISGISPEYVIPDIDSRAETAEQSLHQLGSIGYLAPITPAMISTPHLQRNPDRRLRRAERAYQSEPVLENLIQANHERYRAGQALFPFLEDFLDYLKDPNHYLGIKVPLPFQPERFARNQTIKTGRIVSEGRRPAQPHQDNPNFVDRTVLELSTSPGYPIHPYRLVLVYESWSELKITLRSPFLLQSIPPRHALSRGYPGLNNLAVSFSINSSGRTIITYIANEDVHESSFPKSSQHAEDTFILDVREIPELLFTHLKLAAEVYRNELAEDLRSTVSKHDIVPEVFSFIRYTNELDGKVTEDHLLTSAFQRADFRGILETIIKNEIVDRLKIPESGIPAFSKFETEIAPSWSRKISKHNRSYYLSLDLYYDDIIVENKHNEILANRYSEHTHCEYDETPAITANTIRKVLQNVVGFPFSECEQKWECEPEVLHYDGVGIDVVIHCQIKLDICLFNWLMIEFD